MQSVVKLTITYGDDQPESMVFRNGEDITTAFGLNGSSRIDPVAENAKRIAMFGYDKNFEYYVLNQIEVPVDASKQIKSVSMCCENNGYAVLIYGITYEKRA